jgi:hypothetical protein
MRVKTCPTVSNGSSTGRAPIHVRIITTLMKNQNKIFEAGCGAIVRNIPFCENGRMARIKIDIRRATTPPSLFGIERKIA